MTATSLALGLFTVLLAILGWCVIGAIAADRRLRRHLAQSAQDRWEILQTMPAGPDKDRLIVLHGRAAEITGSIRHGR